MGPATLLSGIGRLVTMEPDLGVVEDAQVLLEQGRIVWIGHGSEEVPSSHGAVRHHLDCGGRAVLPALVECHTHLVFGGDRADEFGLRSSGVSYEEIAKRGGGIRSTVRATRAASLDELVEAALPRVDAMLERGVTCVEVKSGYGLDLETELRMLRAARRLSELRPVRIVGTFLGAHTVPPEFHDRREAYLDRVCEEMIPAVAAEGLAAFCDVFCERGVFSVEESRRVLETGAKHGLVPKVHAEQLHHTGGTALGVALGAASVDHLERVTDDDVRLLARSGRTTAVLLPGATLYLGMDVWAPARKLLDAGVDVALSTDCNPGSCMCDDLPLMTTLGCTRLSMSPAEALRGVTLSAARALGLGAERGSIRVGKAADLLVVGAEHEQQIPYRFGRVRPFAVVSGGEIVRGPGCTPMDGGFPM